MFPYELMCLIVVVLQLQNGPDSQSGPFPMCSSTVTGGTVSSEHAGDIHIPSHPTASSTLSQRARPLCTSGESLDPSSGPLFTQDQDLGRGKRKLPSPEGRVRQNSLPQPQSGKERRWQEEGEEEQQRWSREGGVGQMSENCLNRETGQNQDPQQSNSGQNKEWNVLFYQVNPPVDSGPFIDPIVFAWIVDVFL